MAIDHCCESYTKAQGSLCKMRDFLAGEDTVKKAGERYLRRLADQTPEEFESYKDRATFLNATCRTHNGLVGQIFLKDPDLTLPEGIAMLEQDADLGGSSLYKYARKAVSETLAVGRSGTLIDWADDEKRPYLCLYRREEILNWQRSRIAGKLVLTLVVLREYYAEQVEVTEYAPNAAADPDELEEDRRERILVLSLNAAGQYMVQKFEKEQGQDKQGADKWIMVESKIPQRSGAPLDRIPFVFHDAEASDDDCPRPPLEDLLSLNLNHYRTSADHKHGLHFTALPTAWVAGFDSKTQLRIGSSVAWVSESAEAKAGYLEFSGAGLGTIRAELDKLEANMASMGARLLETQKREAESAEALALRQAGESSVLSSAASGISDTLTQALKLAAWWTGGTELPEDIQDDVCSITLNTDFSTTRMTGAEVVSFVSAWQSGGISRATLHYNLEQSEILPPGTDMDTEVEAILADTLRAPQGAGMPGPGDTGPQPEPGS